MRFLFVLLLAACTPVQVGPREISLPCPPCPPCPACPKLMLPAIPSRVSLVMDGGPEGPVYLYIDGDSIKGNEAGKDWLRSYAAARSLLAPAK